MAHFYGTLQGGRGQASRLGHKSSGLAVTAASWEGAVEVHLYHDEDTGRDMARVSLVPWHGAGCRRELYDGPVSGGPELPVETIPSEDYGQDAADGAMCRAMAAALEAAR